MPFEESSYVMDGGNFVTNGVDTAILTKAFLRDNNLEENTAKHILSELTGYEHIVLLDYDLDDRVPHADGLVMFGDATKLFMHYSDSPYFNTLEQQLTAQLPSTV